MNAAKSTGPAASILVVEDEADIRRALHDRLAHWGFTTRSVETAEEAREEVRRAAPDACILDVRLPGEDGISLCRWLRKEMRFSGPIIFLTARDGTGDKVLGLDTGADDYITKPYDFRELVARLKAQLRPKLPPKQELEIGPLRLDAAGRKAFVRGRLLNLTNTEFELLVLLVSASPKALSRLEILKLVWGYSEDAAPNTRTVDVHVSRLREKMGPTAGACLQSVPKVGYRFLP